MPFFTSKTKIEQLERDSVQLQTLLSQAGGTDLNNIVQTLNSQKAQLEANLTQLQGMCYQEQQRLSALQNEAACVNQQVIELKNTYFDASFLSDYGLNEFAHPAQNSLQLQAELENVRSQIKQMLRDKAASSAVPNFTFNNSVAKGRKFTSDMQQMMLRSYNAEAENAILTVKAGNGEAARKRLDRAKQQVERIGRMVDLRIADLYHALRLQELDLALRYQNAKKAEKEAEREEKARLREERRAQQELEAERERLRKEQAHYQNAISQLQANGETEGLAQLQGKLAEIDSQIESVDFRVANQRAGYVYVISNIGSFGENMVKIGMTRRLNPEDRIRELSDASVPFNFDTHALFFSDDAVTVETSLHHRFADKRVNLINVRREFFAVSPLEVKEALKEIPGVMIEFIEEPEALQYRESQALRTRQNSNAQVPPTIA